MAKGRIDRGCNGQRGAEGQDKHGQTGGQGTLLAPIQALALLPTIQALTLLAPIQALTLLAHIHALTRLAPIQDLTLLATIQALTLLGPIH